MSTDLSEMMYSATIKKLVSLRVTQHGSLYTSPTSLALPAPRIHRLFELKTDSMYQVQIRLT